MTTKEERNSRARDNQRLSRARRIDYIASLEEKVRQFEKGGVAATQQMQASARSVEKQNAQLKSWLCRAVGLREGELQEWLKLPNDTAEKCFNAHLLTRRTSTTSSVDSTARTQHSARSIHRNSSHPKLNSDTSTSDNSPFTPQSSSVENLDLEQSVYSNHTSSQVPRNRGKHAQPNQWHEPTYAYSNTLGSMNTALQFPGPQMIPYQQHGHAPAYMYGDGVSTNLSNGFIAQMPSASYHQQAMPELPPQGTMSKSRFPTLNSACRNPSESNASSSLPAEVRNSETTNSSWLPNEDDQFPNFLNLLGGEGVVFPACGDGLSPIGQQFCSLLTLLAPTVTSSDFKLGRQLTCRESYQALQHILGGKVSVEEVVGKLMNSARSTPSGMSYVDPAVVEELLQSIGVEQGGTCTEQGACCA